MAKNIDKDLYPDSNELNFDKDGTPVAHIVDVELDAIECKFNNDDAITIDTENLSYIVLSRNNLCQLLELFDEARDHWETVEYAENIRANHRK